jgi:hypothetical protein
MVGRNMARLMHNISTLTIGLADAAARGLLTPGTLAFLPPAR